MVERTLTAGAGVLTRTMLALTLALLGTALMLGAGRDGETWKALGLALLVLPVLWKGLPLLCGRLARLGAAKVWLLLTLLCLAVKGGVDTPDAGAPLRGLRHLLGVRQGPGRTAGAGGRALYGPLSPHLRLCFLSRLVYPPAGAGGHCWPRG